MVESARNRFATSVKGFLLRESWVQAVGSVVGIRLLSSAAAFLANVLVARYLLPVRYGYFAILFAVMTVMAGLTGPALDSSLVRFAARYAHQDWDEAVPYFRLVFRIKCWIGAVVLAAGILFAGPVLRLLFHNDVTNFAMHVGMTLAFLGGVVLTFVGFAQAYFQTQQRFARFAAFELTTSMLRLTFVLVVLGLGLRSVTFTLGAYVAAPIVIALTASLQLPRGLFRGAVAPGVAREFLHFAKWVVLASLFTSAAQRMDILLLGYFRIPEEMVGNYGAAVNLVLVGEMLVLTFYNVLLPKASNIATSADMTVFLRKFMAPALLCGLGMVPLVFCSDLLARVTFGHAYAHTGALFSALFCGTLAAITSAPAVAAFYGLGYSKIIAASEGIRLVLSFLVGIWALPRYGAAGMAWTMTGVRCTITVAVCIAAYVEAARLRRREVQAG